jgi:hypothetical protein
MRKVATALTILYCLSTEFFPHSRVRHPIHQRFRC